MKLRLLKKVLPLTLCLALAFCACGSNTTPASGDNVVEATEAPTAEPTPAPTPEPTAEPTPAPTEVPVDWYQETLNKSILSTGTNGRLEKVVEKIKNGEDVYISMIGGSVTEGAGATTFAEAYGEQFIFSLQDTYSGSAIHYYNAGLGGTPSTLGLMRYERDVTEVIGTDPDLVIVEFAVNDWEEPTSSRAYEALVRTILEKENEPAVILLFSVFQSKWNMQDNYIPIGKHYGLPMVSIKDAAAYAYKTNNVNDDMFFADIYHPTDYGHKIMADCLCELISRIDTMEVPAETTPLPDTGKYDLDFMNMHLVTSKDANGVQISPGGFNQTDTALQTFSRTTLAAFPDNWMHTADSGSESFTATMDCKNILLSYKLSSDDDFGFACVYVDGEFVTELFGYQDGGWNNCNTVLVLDEDTVATHTLEIKMSEGMEDFEFTILGIGYTD